MKGKRIVITRAVHQVDELQHLLTERGAIPVLYPCIAIVPPQESRPLDQAVGGLAAGEFDWLVLTSSNTVDALAARLAGKRLRVQAAAVGSVTAQAAQKRLGLSVLVIPQDYTAAALGASLAFAPQKRILLPQSALSDPTLGEVLAAKGAEVTRVIAYQTILGRGGESLAPLLATNKLAAITFTSPSTVRFFLERLREEHLSIEQFADVCMGCIGSKTAGAVRFGGQLVVPTQHTAAHLIQSLEDYFAERDINYGRRSPHP